MYITKYICIPGVPQCLSPRTNCHLVPPHPLSRSVSLPRNRLVRGWGGPSSDECRKGLGLCLLCGVDCKVLYGKAKHLCLSSIVRSQESAHSHKWKKSSIIGVCSYFKTPLAVSFSSVFHVQSVSKCEKRGKDDHVQHNSVKL